MTLKELKEKIAESDINELLNSVSVTINYPHLDYSISLNGLSSVYQFVLSQVKGWNQLENLPNELEESKKFFEKINRQIVSSEPYFQGNQENVFRNHWNNIKTELSSSTISGRGQNIFTYNSPETIFLLDVFKDKPQFISGALDYISQRNIGNIQDKNYLSGIITAYEFKNQDNTSILQRRNQEKKSLGSIRTQFQEHLNESESHLNDFLKRTQDNLNEHFEIINELKIDREKAYNDWFSKTEDDFNIFYDLSKQNIIDNENLYREKLRLEAPADYWKKRGKTLKNDGQKFLIWLIILIVFAANGLFILLFQIPDGMLLKVFDDKVTAIKWSIILVTMISLLAYGIKILARLTFSSYHLSRDAEEREQLTHFYLALKQDTSVSDNDRQLILQSLFSRADSGLLKEDSSPTMPTSGIFERLKQ